MSYGRCVTCGGKGVTRERRPNGDTVCENGHRHSSASFDRHAAGFDAAVEEILAKCDASKANGDPGKYISGLSVADAWFIARLIRELRK